MRVKKMPWCKTCAEDDDPNWMEREEMVLYWKHTGLIQYLKCKWMKHRCYL